MNITIVGAGNVGTQIAVLCAEKNHRVTMMSSKPEKINHNLKMVDENNELIHCGNIYKATNSSQEAFNEAELIFITLPAMCMKDIAHKIECYARKGLMICLVPGTGGGECAFRTCIERGATVFGLQRVPSVARLVEYGNIVRTVGYRDELFVGAIPNANTQMCCDLVENIIGIKTTALPNYLNITLTPSNPILHTTRLKSLFDGWKEGMVYPYVPLFYEEWDNVSSELLLLCDSEVQEICRNIPQLDLSYVKSLKDHYESYTIEAMTNKIRSIKGFKGLKSPVLKVEDGFVPDFNSRYFIADFSYGLAILIQIAKMANSSCTHMMETLNWYQSITHRYDHYKFADYQIKSLKDLIDFYK